MVSDKNLRSCLTTVFQIVHGQVFGLINIYCWSLLVAGNLTERRHSRCTKRQVEGWYVRWHVWATGETTSLDGVSSQIQWLEFGEFPHRCVCICASVQLLSRVQLFATPWTAACQASLSITSSRSLLKLTSIESVMPSSHLILCCPLLLLP